MRELIKREWYAFTQGAWVRAMYLQAYVEGEALPSRQFIARMDAMRWTPGTFI